MKGDIRNLSQFKDRQFGAVYVGHVFECLAGNEIKKAWSEVNRVADEVYVAHLPPESLSARYLVTVKSMIHTAPPTTPYLAYTDLATGKSGKLYPVV